jgi:hypothetical protein
MDADIYKLCGICGGTGVVVIFGGTTPCTSCNGVGKTIFGDSPEVGSVLSDIADLTKHSLEYLQKILAILEKT